MISLALGCGLFAAGAITAAMYPLTDRARFIVMGVGLMAAGTVFILGGTHGI